MSGERKRILVIGSRGQVARALIEALQARGCDVSVAARPAIDLADPATLGPAVRAARPSIVINPAAFTDVDGAEDAAGLAMAINCEGAATLAAEAYKVGAAIIHFSTDYVFDGRKRSPYLESDDPAPLGVYGRSKLAGDLAVAAANPHHVILRSGWIFSPNGKNFVTTILRLARERPLLRVVDDQHGTPTFASDIADAVCRIIALSRRGAGEHCGTFHLASAGETTWCGFARAIIAASAARGGPTAEIVPIGSVDYPTRAKRPAYSRLATDKLTSIYGLTLPDWHDGLVRCMDAIINR